MRFKRYWTLQPNHNFDSTSTHHVTRISIPIPVTLILGGTSVVDVSPNPSVLHHPTRPIGSANHSTNQDHATYPDQSARTRHEPHGYKYRTQFHARHSGSERDQSNNSPEGPTRTTSDHHLGPALGRRSELSDHPLGSTRTSLIYKYSVQ